MAGEAVASPCVSVCKVDSDFICIGCGRHIEDIMRWRDMSNAERQAALDRAPTPNPNPNQ